MNSPIEDFVAADLEFHQQDRGRRRQLGARLAGRQHVRADQARPDLAGHDRAPGPGAHAGRARGDPYAIMSRDADLARSSAMVHIAGIESWLRTALTD